MTTVTPTLPKPERVDIPMIIWDQASPMERYLLSEIAGLSVQLMQVIEVTGEVLTQAKATNGRVTGLETREKAADDVLEFVRKGRKVFFVTIGVVGPVVMLIAHKVIERYF